MVKSIKKILKKLIIALMLTVSIFSNIYITAYADSSYIEKEIKRLNLVNVEEVIRIDKVSSKQSILIYSSHSQEAYKDWDIIKAGEELSKQLESYGYSVTHLKNDFSKNGYNKSYSSSRDVIKSIVKDYDIALDLHRDVGNDNKIMFVVVDDQDNYKQQRVVIDEIKGNIDTKCIKNDTIYNNVVKNNNFNQDLGNVYLVELGGVDNTKHQIEQLILKLSSSIDSYFKSISER